MIRGEKSSCNNPRASRENYLSKMGKIGKDEGCQALDSPIHPILYLQQSAGNRVVQGLFNSGVIQAKLKIGQPSDLYEQEADRVAKQVMRMAEPEQSLTANHWGTIQRKGSCPLCREEEEGILQAKPNAVQLTPMAQTGIARGVSSDIENSVRSLEGRGASLSESSRAFFEPRFNSDFSDVRIHTDSRSEEAAMSVNASAFTLGKDIFFAPGQYSPATSRGKQLLAHELAHTIQQGGAIKDSRRGGSDTLQRQADINQAPPGLACALVTGSGAFEGSHLLFPLADSSLNANHQAHIAAFVNQWTADGASDDVQVDGYASVDGSQAFNWRLSCQRAESVSRSLIFHGIPANKISLVAHGETDEFSAADLVRNRRVIISRHQAPAAPGGAPPAPPVPAPPAAAPQLTGTVVTGPDPDDCGEVLYRVRWEISRNSAPVNGGYVIQDVTFTWDTRDCSGVPVPNPDPRRSPLHYFEAWRVPPNSTNSPESGSVDRFFWPGNRPWAGDGTTGNLRIMATAHYHDNVSTLPAHMIINNGQTFANTLRSSLTDPNVGGNVSQAVEHRLLTHWNCCPAGQPQLPPTIVDGHTP